MIRSILAGASLVALVALAGCSSNDDDDATLATTPTGTANPGIAEGEPDPNGSGGTSMPSDLPPLSSEPGGDTSTIAGYWNAPRAADDPTADGRFVEIAANGLYTSYELARDDVDMSNCYLQRGPQTLSPSADVADGYELSDMTSFSATRSEDGRALTVRLDDPGLPEPETWTLVEGMMAQDLPICSDS